MNPMGKVSDDRRQRRFNPRAGIEATLAYGCAIGESMDAEKRAGRRARPLHGERFARQAADQNVSVFRS
jgi:hypothetical protein